MTNSTELFINHLLSQMTLEEKIGQLNQPKSGDRIEPDTIRQGNVGSLIRAAGALTGQDSSGSDGAEQANHLQQLALESRLKIPLIFGRDVIHGCRTIFPIPLAQAAAFNLKCAEPPAASAPRAGGRGRRARGRRRGTNRTPPRSGRRPRGRASRRPRPGPRDPDLEGLHGAPARAQAAVARRAPPLRWRRNSKTAGRIEMTMIATITELEVLLHERQVAEEVAGEHADRHPQRRRPTTL